MDSNQTKRIALTLNKLAESEKAIAELYKSFSEFWPENREFWDSLKNAELRHSGFIIKMSQIVAARPENFETGRQMKPEDIDIMIEGTLYYIDQVKQNKINKLRSFEIAKNIEQSIIERNYGEILKAKDPEYKNLLDRIMMETILHKSTLDEKLKGPGRQK
jgi:hypothetical protein